MLGKRKRADAGGTPVGGCLLINSRRRCSACPGQCTVLLIAYSEQHQMCDLQRRRFSFRTRDQGLITQELLCSRVLLKWKRDKESFWHRHQEVAESAPTLLVLAKELYTFSVGYYSKSKECLNVAKVLLGPLPQLTF